MSKYKPFLSPLGYLVCGNPYFEEGVNKYTYEVGKCPECNCEYDKTDIKELESE